MATKIKNITNGPKIINAIPPFTLAPGEEYDDFEISDDEKAAALKTGWFEIDGKTDATDAPKEPGPLDGSVDDLTAHLATMDDADEVQKLIDAETAGKSRKGALAALEARRDELLA